MNATVPSTVSRTGRKGATATRVLVGTASWTDPGFIADWYPSDVPARERLAWYAEHFNLFAVPWQLTYNGCVRCFAFLDGSVPVSSAKSSK